jgi:hypothetical protein
MSVMQRCVRDNLDITDVLYMSPAGPMTIRDVFYGWGQQIERTGVEFFRPQDGLHA